MKYNIITKFKNWLVNIINHINHSPQKPRLKKETKLKTTKHTTNNSVIEEMITQIRKHEIEIKADLHKKLLIAEQIKKDIAIAQKKIRTLQHKTKEKARTYAKPISLIQFDSLIATYENGKLLEKYKKDKRKRTQELTSILLNQLESIKITHRLDDLINANERLLKIMNISQKNRDLKQNAKLQRKVTQIKNKLIKTTELQIDRIENQIKELHAKCTSGTTPLTQVKKEYTEIDNNLKLLLKIHYKKEHNQAKRSLNNLRDALRKRIEHEKQKKEKEKIKKELEGLIGEAKAVCAIPPQHVEQQKLKYLKRKIQELNPREIDQQEGVEELTIIMKILDNKINRLNGYIIPNNEADAILENYKIAGIFHMTHKKNLHSILEKGILSHTEAHEKDFLNEDISDQQVNNLRARKEPVYNLRIHDYAPFYFNPRNPMLYKITHDANFGYDQSEILILEIDPRVIYQEGNLFTDGNAASASTYFFARISDISKLNWSIIRCRYWNDHPDGGRIICAETLVYPHLPTKYIKRIHTCSFEVQTQVRNIIDEFGLNIPCSVTRSLYFDNK
ncbi:MAG: DUF4433 domain-containing protein [Candidatus Hydrogenedentota bacterium]|nr:MAG: DUF4433 domain-containing protein [Candidatus Hydrogenedentota bacterium]